MRLTRLCWIPVLLCVLSACGGKSSKGDADVDVAGDVPVEADVGDDPVLDVIEDGDATMDPPDDGADVVEEVEDVEEEELPDPFLYAWSKTFDPDRSSRARAVEQTPGRGFVVAGISSAGGMGDERGLLFGLDEAGVLEWSLLFEIDDHLEIADVAVTSDGGHVIAGEIRTSTDTRSDLWVLKMASDRTIEWQKRYGGTNSELANSIQQTTDGGYIVSGATSSFGVGAMDFYVIKLASDGSLVWEYAYGTGHYDDAREIRQTADGGYIVAGGISFSAGLGYDWDLLVLKLQSNGSVDWTLALGEGDRDDIANSVRQTADGGYIVAGQRDGMQWWVIKLDASGGIVWQNTYQEDYNDRAYSVDLTSDGGYVVAGVHGTVGSTNWVLKLDAGGDVDWQKEYVGPGSNTMAAVHQTSDLGYIIAGARETSGTSGHLVPWILKVSAVGEISGSCPSGMIADTLIGPIASTNAPLTVTFSRFPAASTVADTSIVPTAIAYTEDLQCSL